MNETAKQSVVEMIRSIARPQQSKTYRSAQAYRPADEAAIENRDAGRGVVWFRRLRQSVDFL
jgi:hypothetical protein